MPNKDNLEQKTTSNGVKFILGKKLEMSQIFEEQGRVIPVTLIEAGPCFVTCLKTEDRDGYNAIQVGFEKLKAKKIKKSQRQRPFKYLREFTLLNNFTKGKIVAKQHLTGFKEDDLEYKVDDKINVSIFQEGDLVKVAGISKGKGFQGAVKRWGFSGIGASHGVKHHHRTLGSVGSAFPQRVIKGKKMPGRMGGNRVTVKNLKIIKIDKENNIIAVKGAVPGRRGTLLEIIA